MSYCPASFDEYGELQETKAGTTLTRKCPKGNINATFKTHCNEDGTWSKADLSTCKANNCTSEMYLGMSWPETIAGESVTKDCPDGKGTITRNCNYDGTWGNINSTTCKIITNSSESISCPVDGDWPSTRAMSTASIKCPTGLSGSQTRLCNADGKWGNTNSTACKLITNSSESVSFCPAEDVWQVTKVGDIAKVSCDHGGEKSRECLEGGIWGDIDTSNCSDETKYCSEDGEWERTASGNISKQNCLFGLSEKTRRCNTDGIWEDEDSSSCNNMYIIIGIIICICVLFFIIIIIKVSRSHSSVNNLSSDTI